MLRLVASPHRSEAITNRMIDQRSSRTCPMRRASQPVSGSEMAVATPNDVIDPCALIRTDAEIAGDRRDRDVRNRLVEDLHESRERKSDRRRAQRGAMHGYDRELWLRHGRA